MRSRDAADAISRSFLRSPARPEFLFEKLGQLDAGRAVDAVHGLARHAGRLHQELAQAGSGDDGPAGVRALMRACADVEDRYGWSGQPVGVLPHIGWGEVVEPADAAYRRYGFTSMRSFEAFEELLRYLSGACQAAAGVHALALETLGELAGSGAVCSLARDVAEWRSAGAALDRAAEAVREVCAHSDDFARRRQLAKDRAATSKDAPAARLLSAIGAVRSPWAWLGRAPGSRLLDCEPVGGYRLRLRFADGLDREIELGEDFWSTTGHAPDAEQFGTVVIDQERNRLVWANGVEIPGERLHLAILEGRLPAS